MFSISNKNRPCNHPHRKPLKKMGRAPFLNTDVTQVKQSDMQEDVSVILQRLDEAEGQISMLEDDNDRLI